MLSPNRDRVATAFVLCLLGVALLAALPASAAPEKGYVAFEARLEPQDLGPGQKGVLVVTSKLRDHHYVYATSGSSALAWRPKPVKGVTYDVPAPELTWEAFQAKPGHVLWTKPKMHVDESYPDMPPYPVWEEGYDLEIRVPVTLAADVAKDAALGLEIDYSACDPKECYRRVMRQRALVVLGKSPPPPAAKLSLGAFPEDETAKVTLAIDERDGKFVAVVTFVVNPGYHLYQPGAEGQGLPIEVEPLSTPGITWGDWFFDEEGSEFEDPYPVELPFTKAADAKELKIHVKWQGCSESGCVGQSAGLLIARWGAAPPPEPAEPEPAPAPAPAPGPVDPGDGVKRLYLPTEAMPFEQVWGDDLDAPRKDGDWKVVDPSSEEGADADGASGLASRWQKSWILFLLAVFVFGVGLAFTPCVLPIIPLTVSVIGGGNPNISRPRLSLLLGVYVLGLSLTYGSAGAASGWLGDAIDINAAFRIPAVIWGIAALFVILAAGMLGIYELQPPAWMERMRGGAQGKSGTLIGSFLLGMLAAVIASPCTGPFVVGMLAWVATEGNALLGFFLFFTLGLGMGAVFFAAGSLNLLVRPGVWMVWVRYAFGILLLGVALYYLANQALLPTWALLALGIGLAFLVFMAVTRHLYRREGETLVNARMRALILACLVLLTTMVVVALTHSPAPDVAGILRLAAALAIGIVVGLGAWLLMGRGSDPDAEAQHAKRWEKDVPRLITVISLVVISVAVYGSLARPVDHGPPGWVKLKDVDHLKAEVEKAKRLGKPVVVDVWATWCTYCKAYDHVIEDDAYLRKTFENELVRLKVSVEHDDQEDLRTALGIPFKAQPRMAFLDEEGRIRRAADVEEWYKELAGAELRRRVDFLLRRTQ